MNIPEPIPTNPTTANLHPRSNGHESDTIVVTVVGGNVQNVDGPSGVVVEVRDYDKAEGIDKSLTDAQLADEGYARDDEGDIYSVWVCRP